MSHHHWDELAKSLSEESLPRRESLRRIGAVLAGAVFSPLGLGTVFAGKPNPCKAFCKCRNKRQQNACLAACKACGNDPRFLCGSCAGGYACTDLANDPYNCGACRYKCEPPGPYEYGACIDGECHYTCAEGAVRCNGTCTYLEWDPDHCGACGRVCGGSAPYCSQGECSDCPPGMALCGGECVDLLNHPDHCGACGNVCGGSTPYCSGGQCTNCGGWGAAICDGVCINLLSDSGNCGACGVQCAADELCTFGVCTGTCSGCYY